MVEIRSKRGRQVPVIFTTKTTSSINLLIKTRKDVCIPEENTFILARPTRISLNHVRAHDCLRKVATQCEPVLSNLAAIKSTSLRKHIATTSQVLSLKETEVDWLARHLGHHTFKCIATFTGFTNQPLKLHKLANLSSQ